MSRFAVDEEREREERKDEWTEGGKHEISDAEILAVLRECDVDTALEEGGKPRKANIDDLNYIIKGLEEQVAALERQLQHRTTQAGAVRMLIDCLDLDKFKENREYILNLKTQILRILRTSKSRARVAYH